MNPKVSLIIPTFNEERGLNELIQESKDYCDEIIVVDGDSTDRTVEVASSAGAKVVSDLGRGKGEAIRLGLEEAQYPIVVFMDADWSHDPKDIPKIVAPIARDEKDMVVASRIQGGSAEFYGSLDRTFRRWGSSLITLGINLRFGTKLTDSQNGFRGIKKNLGQKLNLQENMTTIEQEMLIKALAKKLRVGEVPSFESERRYGTSRINIYTAFPRYVYSWFRYLSFPE